MNKSVVADRVASRILSVMANNEKPVFRKWGFDLTDISGVKFARILKSVGLNPDKGVRTRHGWEWRFGAIVVETGNNPMTGENPRYPMVRRPDYASYIGIEGNPVLVAKVAEGIRRWGSSKDESPGKRDFI